MKLRTLVEFGFAGRGLLLLLLVSVPSFHFASVHAGWTTPTKLGPEFNGPDRDYFPFITANSMRFYWSSSSFPEVNGLNEDIFYVDWDSSIGDWGPRIHIDSAVNTVEREFSPCESPDGRYLWFIRYNGSSSYDLFYSVRDTLNNKWNVAQNAGPQFNSNCSESGVSISPDGRRMFLVHGIRPGTIGCEGEVLWVSYWNESTQWWDTLIWMGNSVNGGSTQNSAAMSLDTNSLVIASSSGYPGTSNFGRSDIYTVMNNSPAWDSILNVGMPPNSAEIDGYLSLSADGLTLYLSSTRESNSSDIFVSTNVPSDLQEEPAVPRQFELGQARPNPFNSSVVIELWLGTSSVVSLDIFDLLGRHVQKLFHGHLAAGRHDFTWEARAQSSGVYWVRATSGPQASSRRMLLVK